MFTLKNIARKKLKILSKWGITHYVINGIHDEHEENRLALSWINEDLNSVLNDTNGGQLHSFGYLRRYMTVQCINSLEGPFITCNIQTWLPDLTCLMYGILFLQLSNSLGCFRPRTFFLKNRLDWFPWTSFISYLHTILRIISRSVSGWIIDSPCGVWNRG